MAGQEATAPDSVCHPDVWALLPWAATGTLDGMDRRAVEDRLATCDSCRAELARCHVVAAAVLAAPVPARSPTAADVSRVLARAGAAGDTPSPIRAWARRWRAQVRRELAVLRHAPPALRWTVAFQGALIVLLVSLAVWQAAIPASPYQTLARGGEGAAGARPEIRVAFAEDMTERELRALLASVEGALVGGPSTLGIYTIRVESPSAALETLRAHAKVRLAEPSPGR
jgi:hypothetical protein